MVLFRITDEDIHSITSGQVIIELASIIKELLENSIDANSTSISITFKRYGLEGLEISDNGNGIKQDDFQNLCLKNYTSKLENFESLTDTTTLGFRGEALNSICNIGKMVITTATASDSPKGFELYFDKFGRLTGQKIVGQSKGTIIKVSEIFKDLPVRKLNLEKHYRREFQNCLNLLTSYLLILTDVRIIITNIDISGKKKLIMKTTGNKLIKDNIINVFGSTGLQGMKDVNLVMKLDETYSVKMDGMLSGASFGDGRLTKDRQYIYINKRPVKFQKLIKLINQIYKKFKYLQNPVVILNIELDVKLLDLNVNPDKSIVLISNRYETILFERIESVLEDFWDNSGTYSIPVDEVVQEKICKRNIRTNQPRLESFTLFKDNEDIEHLETVDHGDNSTRVSIRNSRVISKENISLPAVEKNEIIPNKINPEGSEIFEPSLSDNSNYYDSNEGKKITKLESEIEQAQLSCIDEINETNDEGLDITSKINASDMTTENPSTILDENPIESESVNLIDSSILQFDHSESCCGLPASTLESEDQDQVQVSNTDLDNNLKDESIISAKTIKVVDEKVVDICKHLIRIPEQEMLLPNKRKCLNKKRLNTIDSIKASDFTDKKASEEFLGLSIHKSDFNSMDIVGQFNKGFIITYKKDTNDILIIDQHASDEKYNFENLVNKTILKNQPLVMPQKLDLNSMERLVIINNLEVFEKNGFKFREETGEADTNNKKQEELYLTSLPFSKNTTFNLKDLSELIQIIQDNGSATNAVIRPSKVRAMFAMRACRSSIMIGKPLNKSKMKVVVQHLSTLDKPWNCPHGRPTMRHLVKIDQWKSFEDDYIL
jgi:DNA mismatch repair protein PMS2